MLLALTLLACARTAPPPPAAEAQLAVPVTAELEVTLLRPGVWLYSSGRDEGGVDSVNGLLVAEPEGGILLIGTPWGSVKTEALLSWVGASLGQEVTAAVVTHAPVDGGGAVAALIARGLPVVGHPHAARLAGAIPIHALRTLESSDAIYLEAAELFYPGPGPTQDGLVAWLPDTSVLFGAGLVEPAAAAAPDSSPTVDLVSWRIALDRVSRRYPDAAVVVPGHGAPGDVGLLAHTVALLGPSTAPASPALTGAHRELCESLTGPTGVGDAASADPARLRGTGALGLEDWVLTGDDLGLRVAQGFPLRTDLAFRHEGGWLVCTDPYGSVSPSVLQERRHCAPLPDESDVWWWCPLGG